VQPGAQVPASAEDRVGQAPLTVEHGGPMARMAVMTVRVFAAEGGRILLPLTDCIVNRCCVDWAVTLEMQAHDGDRFELRIGDTFTFTTADGVEKSLQPEEDPAGLGPILVCTRTAVKSATIGRATDRWLAGTSTARGDLASGDET
jgi:hypothetical protein